MFSSQRLHKLIDRIYLIYLGLLPVGATFAVSYTYGREQIFLLFLGGIVLVSVYLAVIASYTPFPKNLWITVLSLIDGPLIALTAQRFGGDGFSWMIDSFLVDGLAIWLVITWLALSTNRPTAEQRWMTLGFGLIAMLSLGYLVWPHLATNIWGDWLRIFWLLLGVVEALGVRYFLLERDKVLRDNDFSMGYILIFLIAWFVMLILGNILREIG